MGQFYKVFDENVNAIMYNFYINLPKVVEYSRKDDDLGFNYKRKTLSITYRLIAIIKKYKITYNLTCMYSVTETMYN